ncbi:MAG: patatin-like phospholipase family protein [Bacteroidales bacterium]
MCNHILNVKHGVRGWLLAPVFLIFLHFSGFSQTVSLVFSGGGAKGLAHVGVIKALEENGIPISNVSGTSMGAIVAGLYAMGYTPEEMVTLFKSKEFNNWSRGIIDDDLKYNINDFTRSDAENLSVGFTLDKKGIRPKITSGFIPTVGMDIAFEKLCSQANTVAGGDFNRLFVPFRCNASDIVAKKTVYFRNGNLGRAIRASMTYPMYFKPIYIDSVLMFDGGIYNNFLWKEALKEFNPDVIIGSKVASNSDLPDDEDPLLQIESMIVGDTDYDIPDSLGLVIDTPFSGIGVLDFDLVDEIVNSGYQAALVAMPELKRRIAARIDVEEVNQKRQSFKAKFPALNIGEINIAGLKANQQKYVNRVIFGKKEVVDFNKFGSDYYRLMSDRVFERLFPELKFNPDRNVFDVDIAVKLKRSTDIGLGLSLSSDFGNEGFMSINRSWLSTTSNTIYGNLYFGKLYNSTRITYNKTTPTRLPVSLIAQFVGNRLDYHSSNSVPFFEDYKPDYIIQSEYFGSVGVKVSHTNAANISCMFSFGEKSDDYYQVDTYYSYDTPDNTKFRFVKGSLRYEKQTLNDKQFATRGRHQVIVLSAFTGQEKHDPGTTAPSFARYNNNHTFFTAYVHNESYHKVFSRGLRLGIRAEGYWTNLDFFDNYKATILNVNQFSPMTHSNTLFMERYRADRYFALGAAPLFMFGKSVHLRLEAYYYQPIRVIYSDSNGIPHHGDLMADRKLIGVGSLVYSSPIGPVAATVAYFPSNGEKQQLYFNVTFGYSLFNPKVFDN